MKVGEEPLTNLSAYGHIPIAFEIRSLFECTIRNQGLGGIFLTERVLDSPYVKDYDAIAGGGPERWLERFDTSNWGLLVAREHGRRVGGATIAYDSACVDMLENRQDLAVLWDLRVSPRARRRGIGSALFQAAVAWARTRDCRLLKVETQNINVPACRFYARQGCTLGAINLFAYPSFPDEIQLLWYRDLDSIPRNPTPGS